jgi:hypothetical protein
MRLDSFGALIRIDRGVVSFSGSALRTALPEEPPRPDRLRRSIVKNPYLQRHFPRIVPSLISWRGSVRSSEK